MKKKLSPILALLLAIVAAFFGYTGLTDDAAAPSEPVSIVQDVTEAVTDAAAEEDATQPEDPTEATEPEALLDPDGSYTTKEDVALYLYTYGKLPSNFMTKKEAQSLGWSGGGLDGYADGMCIGGDRFGNYEGLLPDADGRKWTECDLDTLHADSRGAKRIVFSNDGLIYYTGDHYESFELLYGEP